MFDQISGGPRHPFHKPTVAPTLVSVAGHGMLLLTLAGTSFLATGELPEVPDMMAFVVAEPAPAPPPPPPPPPPAPPRAAASVKPRALPVASPAAAPVEAPSAVLAEPIVPWDEGLEGVEGGVEGGIVGGVPGGVVGGLVGALPLPPPPPPPEPARPVPVRIGGQITAPELVHRVNPSYPGVAMHAKITGMVILEATVDSTGSVESVQVIRSVPLLDKAAVEAVKQWRYSPLVLNGVPSPFILTVVLSFSLKT